MNCYEVKNMTPLAVVAGIVERGGETLVCRRPAASHQGLLWEFPGGKIEKGESPEEALVRELREELDIETAVTGIYDARITEYPEKTVLILFYRVRIVRGEPRPVEEDAVRWVKGKEALNLDFAPADRPVAEKLFD